MQVLIRGQGKGKKAVAHLWDGQDTFCRMFSTGGMRPDKYSLKDRATNTLKICNMCQIREDKNNA